MALPSIKKGQSNYEKIQGVICVLSGVASLIMLILLIIRVFELKLDFQEITTSVRLPLWAFWVNLVFVGLGLAFSAVWTAIKKETLTLNSGMILGYASYDLLNSAASTSQKMFFLFEFFGFGCIALALIYCWTEARKNSQREFKRPISP